MLLAERAKHPPTTLRLPLQLSPLDRGGGDGFLFYALLRRSRGEDAVGGGGLLFLLLEASALLFWVGGGRGSSPSAAEERRATFTFGAFGKNGEATEMKGTT